MWKSSGHRIVACRATNMRALELKAKKAAHKMNSGGDNRTGSSRSFRPSATVLIGFTYQRSK